MHLDDVTRLLASIHDGDGDAIDRLFPLVYRELREIAHRQLRRERADITLDTSAVVHEAYLNMANRRLQEDWQGRQHFLAVAALAMRQILVDYARAHKAEKRGGGQADLPLDETRIALAVRPDEFLALDEALGRLSRMDERQVRIVEYRYFTGLTIEETAEVLGVSTATVKRDWASARLWLNREVRSILNEGESDPGRSSESAPA